MAPSRKVNNGRSPLVNKQHQITAFFTKSAVSPLLKPNPPPQSSPLNPQKTLFSKPQNPKPNPNISPSSSPPATPSPFNPKSKPKSIVSKPPLVVGSQKPSDLLSKSAKELYGDEVVNRRIRVYWPLDAAWYEGRVKSFDTVLGKHLVVYDDEEEELIDLAKEKIEWIEVGGELGFSSKRLKRRRLRKASIVVDDDEDEAGEGNVGPVEDGDDSSDEDWGKNGVGIDVEEEEECVEEVELEDEEEVVSLKRKKSESGVSRANKKRKDGVGDGDGEVEDSSNKKKKVGFVFGSKPGKSISNVQGNY